MHNVFDKIARIVSPNRDQKPRKFRTNCRARWTKFGNFAIKSGPPLLSGKTRTHCAVTRSDVIKRVAGRAASTKFGSAIVAAFVKFEGNTSFEQQSRSTSQFSHHIHQKYHDKISHRFLIGPQSTPAGGGGEENRRVVCRHDPALADRASVRRIRCQRLSLKLPPVSGKSWTTRFGPSSHSAPAAAAGRCTRLVATRSMTARLAKSAQGVADYVLEFLNALAPGESPATNGVKLRVRDRLRHSPQFPALRGTVCGNYGCCWLQSLFP